MSYLKDYCLALGLPLSFKFNSQKALYIKPYLLSTYPNLDIGNLIFKLDVHCLYKYNDVVVGGNYINKEGVYISEGLCKYPDLLKEKPLAKSDIIQPNELELIPLLENDIPLTLEGDILTTVDIINALDLSGGIAIMQAALQERILINGLQESLKKDFVPPHQNFF